ncbi:putative nucleic acid-binding protein [Streptosporangium album]|uniref:Putative nucleic acid-binding protein n=1 Tax=Streptosporangium album TaxID=47479 RepID=A0A7W7RXG5_9ACTN|nr:hypothetical protein [Streptosporangium album]MBB4940059.1 putative nucleic acid-binding protein [Streptosporangium album]
MIIVADTSALYAAFDRAQPEHRSAAEIVEHEGLRLDLADAVGVVLADRYRTNRILTLDQRDFRAIEPLTHGLTAFHILPADR